MSIVTRAKTADAATRDGRVPLFGIGANLGIRFYSPGEVSEWAEEVVDNITSGYTVLRSTGTTKLFGEFKEFEDDDAWDVAFPHEVSLTGFEIRPGISYCF